MNRTFSVKAFMQLVAATASRQHHKHQCIGRNEGLLAARAWLYQRGWTRVTTVRYATSSSLHTCWRNMYLPGTGSWPS